MAKIVRLTESDITRLVRRVINEEEEAPSPWLPECDTKMNAPDNKLNGPFNKLTSHGVSYGSQYYVLYSFGKPFCMMKRPGR
jgi:hypothetical protein